MTCTLSDTLPFAFVASVVQDFKAAGFRWTADLCKLDSDKDGFTNGQELGDADCKVVGILGVPARFCA